MQNISNCLLNNGVVFIRCWQTNEHYVIVTKIKRNKVYIFDPYYFDKNYYDKDRCVKVVFNKSFTHNRIVLLNRFLSVGKKDFSLGPVDKRECILISRGVENK